MAGVTRDQALQRALDEAERRVRAALRKPEARRRLRVAFYGLDDRYEPYSRSELAFLDYEISRGVLGVSTWWRAVNATVCRDAEHALAWYEHGVVPGPEERPALRRWEAFLRDPSETSWYRAHNASILTGYLRNAWRARAEQSTEQYFLCEVLERLMFAHALCEGLLGEAGEVVADPASFGVEVLLADHRLYPREYPAPPDVESVVEKLLDTAVAAFRPRLYQWSADLLELPALQGLARRQYPD